MLAKPFLSNIPFLLAYISLVSSSPTTATGHNGLISRTSHGTRFGHVAAASKKTNSGAHYAAVLLLRAHTAELQYLSKRDTIDPINMIPQIPGSGKPNSSPPSIPIQIDGLVQIPGQSEDNTVKEGVSTPNMNTAVVQGANAGAKSITAGVPKPSDVTNNVPSGPPSTA